ncbi:MAG: hypothetical protein FWG75_03890 [Cystobacterineae bacterium]|nr:hypothetical protein [Cystobacterineae bacterium]
MHKNQSHVWVLSALLAALLVGCASLGKNPVGGLAAQHNVSMDEDEEANAWAPVWALINLEEKVERIITGEGLWIHEDRREWTDKNGVRRIEVDGPPHHPYSYAVEIAPDGSKAFFHGNGNPMKMMEETPGSRIYLIDRNGNGVFDERVTIRLFSKTKTEHERTEYVFMQRTPDGTWGKYLNRIIKTTIRH